MFDCSIRVSQSKWQGTAGIWEGLGPAWPALGYTTAILSSVAITTFAKFSDLQIALYCDNMILYALGCVLLVTIILAVELVIANNRT